MQDIIPPEQLKQKVKKIPSKPSVAAGRVPSTPAAMPKVDETIELDEGGGEATPDKKKLLRRPRPSQWSFDWWRAWSRRRKIITSAVVFVLLVGATTAAVSSFFWRTTEPGYSFTRHKKKVAAVTTVASPLTGLQVDPTLAARPVTGIMIENSDAARPQSGLQDAGVVYEAIAEAGITRFLALFQDASPQYIGPVRSLRPYYIDYAAQYQASIVHVGGSPDALAEVSNGSFRNLDEFANSGAFWRISTRYAPHNVYTSFANLDKLNQSRGYTTSAYTSWPRKQDKKLAVPTAKTIDFSISSPDFYAHYDYDAASNSYLRSEGGAAHLDLVSAADKTGVQLKPKVVIAIVVPQSQGALDASGAYYTDYTTNGSGTAYIFQDGGVTQATWNKADQGTMLTFTDGSGKPIKLNAGQTWITLVSDTNKVSYSAPPPPAAPAKKQ